MSSFNTLQQTQLGTSNDEYLLRQGTIDYKQNRETLAASLSSARWTNSYDYAIGDFTQDASGNLYRARIATGDNTGNPAIDPAVDVGAFWIPWVIPSNPNIIPKNSKIDPIIPITATIPVGTEVSTLWFVGVELTGTTYASNRWNATAGTIFRDIPIKNGLEFYTAAEMVGSTASNDRLPNTAGVTLDTTSSVGFLRITIDFAQAADVFSAKAEIGTLPSLHNVALTSGSGGATGGGADEVFYENGQNVTADYTIVAEKNAGSFGDITIDNGVTVEIENGASWSIV